MLGFASCKTHKAALKVHEEGAKKCQEIDANAVSVSGLDHSSTINTNVYGCAHVGTQLSGFEMDSKR